MPALLASVSKLWAINYGGCFAGDVGSSDAPYCIIVRISIMPFGLERHLASEATLTYCRVCGPAKTCPATVHHAVGDQVSGLLSVSLFFRCDKCELFHVIN